MYPTYKALKKGERRAALKSPSLTAHTNRQRPDMKYSIAKWNAPSTSLHHNDSISPSPYADDSMSDLWDTEEHGHPVVIMESGVDDLDEGGAIYHEKMGIHHTPAHSEAEAIEIAKSYVDEGMKFYQSHGLQAGDVDYYAVEVLKLVEDEDGRSRSAEQLPA